MVPNPVFGMVCLLCLMLAGCAGSPSSPVSTSDVTVQKRQAVNVEPLTDAQQATLNRARQAMSGQRWELALNELQALKTQRPDVSEIHASLAWIARQQGNPDQAMAAYRTAFDLNPNDAASANNLALLLREQGEFRQAVKLLQEGLRYSPNTADLHYNLAVIAELYLLDLELALAHYRKFRELMGQSGEQEGRQVAGWIADLERRLD